MSRRCRGNDLSSSSSPHATAVTQRRQRPLSLSLSLSLSHAVSVHTHYTTNFTKCNNSYLKVCALSHIYTYMTFGLFTYLSFPIGRDRSVPVLGSTGSLYLPSGVTCFPTNSPFTPAWDVAPIRSASDTLPACRVSTPWSACLTRSRLCGSSSARTLVPLLAPGSNDTSAGYASSWSGRPCSSQGGWQFGCHNRVSTPLAGYQAHR